MKLGIFIITAIALVLAACQAQAGTAPWQIIYTKISQCREQVDNPNAAFSELACGKVGDASLRIERQAPQFFNVYLTRQGITARSEWDLISGENPMEAGTALEWHLQNGQAKFLIFRMRYQPPGAAPQQEVLTVNWLDRERICILATVNTAKNANANQQARGLIASRFSTITQCPKDWLQF